jgi:diguanylate cyclase (GGDEF)-like protein
MELNLIAISVQAIGTLLMAVLLWQLTRVIPGRFLRYWSAGWVALAVALFALRIAVSHVLPNGLTEFWLSVYMLGEYVFAYLLWAGFRDFARGQPIARCDMWLLAALVVLGLITLVGLDDVRYFIPVHSLLLTPLIVLALIETFRWTRPTGRLAIGLTVVRAMLFVLTALFLHYAPVVALTAVEPEYLRLFPVYVALAELGLAFGMLLLTTDRVLEQLEEKNRRLAAASTELARAARTDALTGLLNRRGYEELLTQQAGQPFAGALVVIDLNDLKPLNDTHGHDAGDAALQLVARTLRMCVRVTDPIFRIGGDEFLVVLPGGSAADLAARMERIEPALKGQRLPNTSQPIDLTVSWGVAEFASGNELASAVGQADRAMYARKQKRKESPETSPDPSSPPADPQHPDQ